jgi:signal transduction histidine kinase
MLAAATFGRLALAGVLHEQAPLLLFVLPVLAASWSGGRRLGIWTTLAGAVIAEWLFVAPYGGLAFVTARGTVRLIVFLMTGVLISQIIHVLQQARQDAMRAVQDKDEFIAMLAHELRNPLSAIQTAVGVMKTRQSDERRTWARDVIERQAQLMDRLIADLLDVSRIRRTAFDVHRQPVSIVEVLDAAVTATQALARDRNQAWDVRTPDVDAIVLADPDRLQQALANLLGNAARYTAPGGRITVDVTIADKHVAIAIQDTGIGIAPEEIELMFEPFHRGSTSSGLGIGLFLARTFITYNGGTLRATSPGLGHGSTFFVELPVVRTMPRGAPLAEASAE